MGESFASQPKRYNDFRELLEQKDIDAVTVSTPDHMHAPVAVSAMQLGKHVYVQKPLAHTVYEARQMRKIATEQGVATQMGNQHHSSDGYRQFVEYVQSGSIGEVSEVHSWTSRPLWPPSGAEQLIVPRPLPAQRRGTINCATRTAHSDPIPPLSTAVVTVEVRPAPRGTGHTSLHIPAPRCISRSCENQHKWNLIPCGKLELFLLETENV